jgi:hypothetical protein
LYLLLIATPMLGWLHSSAAGFSVVWFGVLPLPDLVGKDKILAETFKELHEGSVNLLVTLVVSMRPPPCITTMSGATACLRAWCPGLRSKS